MNLEVYFTVFGLVFLIYFISKSLKFLCFFVHCYILPSFGLVEDLRKYGEWAVVTGATDGIGKGYANELAKRGLNIVLISRTKVKLEAVASDITKMHHVETKIIVFDFTKNTDYSIIEETLSLVNIAVLINNVGYAGAYLEFYYKFPTNMINDVIQTNITSIVNMTHIILRQMIKQEGGIIVYISSGFGNSPTPLFNVYPATKSFVNTFANMLQLENESFPSLRQQLVTPWFVATKLSGLKESLFVPGAESFAASAVLTIGLRDSVCGYWAHEIQDICFRYFPFVTRKTVFGTFENMRLYKRYNHLKKNT